MRADIDAALSRAGGAATRAALLGVSTRAGIDNEIRRGELVRIAPRVYGRPWSLDDPDVADVAAIRYASPGALLSHTSALRRYGLATGRPGSAHPLHVCIPAHRNARGVPATLFTPGIAVHRSTRTLRVDVSTLVPCVQVETAIVQAWPLLRGPDRRAPLIAAVRGGLCGAAMVRDEAHRSGKPNGKKSLLATLDLLQAGCESELEMWGYGSVFTVAELSAGVWQHSIRTQRGWYRIDLAYPDAKLAVELDGRAYHASQAQWSRDIARDLELAKLGWQTIRLSHARLTSDVEGCRQDVRAVLRQRREWPTEPNGPARPTHRYAQRQCMTHHGRGKHKDPGAHKDVPAAAVATACRPCTAFIDRTSWPAAGHQTPVCDG